MGPRYRLPQEVASYPLTHFLELHHAGERSDYNPDVLTCIANLSSDRGLHTAPARKPDSRLASTGNLEQT